MALYFMPPKDTTSLPCLMKDAETSLLYLCQLYHRWGDDEKVDSLLHDHPHLAYNCDCLIEGSDRDCTSYYMLKLASLGDEKFRFFLTEAETYFLEHRLTRGGDVTIKKTVSEALRHSAYALGNLNLTDSNHEFISQLMEILRNLVIAGINECKNRQFCHHSIKVPWVSVLPMVRTRSVKLVAGQAVVKCQQVVQLMCCLFRTLSVLCYRQLAACKVTESVQEDERIFRVIKTLYRSYRTHQVGDIMMPSRYLHHREVEKESRYFPLCMQELHRILQHNNRLRHHERFRLTVFLKDIGLPLHENLAFWESYYSKPYCSNAGGCQHAWQGRKNQYTYSIRHIYGLEGGMNNRSSHTCVALQNLQPNHQDTGGCPFSSFSPEDLIPLLQPVLGPNTHIQEVIVKEVSAGRPTAACQTVMAYILHMKNLDTRDEKSHSLSYSSGDNCVRSAGNSSGNGSCGLERIVAPKECKVTNIEPGSDLEQVPQPITVKLPQRSRSLSVRCGECHHTTCQSGVCVAGGGLIASGTYKKEQGNSETLAVGVTGLCSRERTSGRNAVGGASCSRPRNTLTVDPICDIEDITAIMPNCVFHRPSQYYLKTVNKRPSEGL